MFPPALQAEIVNPSLARRPIRLAMIDFDGTLSLLREGWDQVMIPMMVECLIDLPGTTETAEELKTQVTDWVLKLNGQPTIMQMEALCREVVRRGGEPCSPAEFKQRYLDRLMQTVEERKRQIQQQDDPTPWLVPGASQMLQSLRQRNIPMLLASGTDLEALQLEARHLQVHHYFTEGIEGPESDTSSFTKAAACDRVLARHQLEGTSLLNIGDGFVETKLTRDRGGIAIGIAYDHDQPGKFNPWRREQLLRAGVDLILPDLQQSNLLLQWLLDGTTG